MLVEGFVDDTYTGPEIVDRCTHPGTAMTTIRHHNPFVMSQIGDSRLGGPRNVSKRNELQLGVPNDNTGTLYVLLPASALFHGAYSELYRANGNTGVSYRFTICTVALQADQRQHQLTRPWLAGGELPVHSESDLCSNLAYQGATLG